MVLLEIQKYLEDNVKVLDHLYAITQVILSKKSEALSDTDKTKIDIENAIFSIIEHIKTISGKTINGLLYGSVRFCHLLFPAQIP